MADDDPEGCAALGAAIAAATEPELASAAAWRDNQAVAVALQMLIQDAGYPKAVVHPFGSCVSGLADVHADLDLACDMDGAEDVRAPPGEDRAVAVVGRRLHELPFEALEVVAQTRVPIIKNDPGTRRAAAGKTRGKEHLLYGAKFDLCFRLNGVFNSRLLRRYFSRDAALRVAGVYLKRWAKRVGAVDPRYGMLSSYALALMLVHSALRSGEAPLIPAQEYADVDVHGALPPLAAPPADPYGRAVFEEKVGRVVRGFFAHFTGGFDYESEVVTVRTADVRLKLDMGWAAPRSISRHDTLKDLHLAIEDPYEHRGRYRVDTRAPEGRNVACNVRRREFDQLMRLLEHGAREHGVEEPERRVDPGDGKLYTRAQFMRWYDSPAQWDAAKREKKKKKKTKKPDAKAGVKPARAPELADSEVQPDGDEGPPAAAPRLAEASFAEEAAALAWYDEEETVWQWQLAELEEAGGKDEEDGGMSERGSAGGVGNCDGDEGSLHWSSDGSSVQGTGKVAPGGGAEWRIDPADGRPYTRRDFEACYGGTAEWDAAIPAEADDLPEHRVDPADGLLYTKADFVACYGGTDEWDAAGQSRSA